MVEGFFLSVHDKPQDMFKNELLIYFRESFLEQKLI